MPESIRNMITPPRNSAPRVQDNEPEASRTPVQAAAPVVDENSIRAQVLAEQKARVNGINDLFAMFGGRYQTLQAQCLADPECSLEQAREKLLNEMGRPMKLLPCWRMRPGCPVPNVWHMDLLIR